MIRERTSAGIAAARAEGRVGGRRKKLDAAKRREIAESVITGRKSGAEMARLYNIGPHRQSTPDRPGTKSVLASSSSTGADVHAASRPAARRGPLTAEPDLLPQRRAAIRIARRRHVVIRR